MAGFRGSGSWIPEVAACTLLTRYIRENFKIATFSRLSGTMSNVLEKIFHQNKTFICICKQCYVHVTYELPICIWFDNLRYIRYTYAALSSHELLFYAPGAYPCRM